MSIKSTLGPRWNQITFLKIYLCRGKASFILNVMCIANNLLLILPKTHHLPRGQRLHEKVTNNHETSRNGYNLDCGRPLMANHFPAVQISHSIHIYHSSLACEIKLTHISCRKIAQINPTTTSSLRKLGHVGKMSRPEEGGFYSV